MRRLWRSLAAVAVLGLACGGCSFSNHLEDMFAKGDDKNLTTGSIQQARFDSAKADTAKIELPPESDLAYARAAVSEVLVRGSKDSAVPWENPQSGARGTVTPLASAYMQDGITCRDFLASYVHKDNESWMQGEACQASGKWEVRSLKPWKRT